MSSTNGLLLVRTLIDDVHAGGPNADGCVCEDGIRYEWTAHRSRGQVQITAMSERVGILGCKYFLVTARGRRALDNTDRWLAEVREWQSGLKK